MASAALSVIPVSYVTETETIDICAPTPPPPSPLPVTVSSQISTQDSSASTTQIEISTEQSSYSPLSSTSVTSSEPPTSSEASAIFTYTSPSSIPQPQTTIQRSTVPPIPSPTSTAVLATSQNSMFTSSTTAPSIGPSTQAYQSDRSGPAITVTSTPMPPATQMTAERSCSWSGPYCIVMDVSFVIATVTATPTAAVTILPTSPMYVTGPDPTTITPGSIPISLTDGFAPTTLSALPTILSSTSPKNLPRDGQHENAVKVTNEGFATGANGHNDDHGPMVPYVFIPALVIAVVFALVIERRIRRVVDRVMENIAMERRRARRL